MGCAILYDLLAAHTVQVMAGAPGTPPAALCGMPAIVGFAADEALLPEEDGGHRACACSPYFAFPDKFHFFDLPLSGALADGQALPVPGLRSRTDGTPAFAGGRLPARLRAGDQPLPRTSEPLRRTAPAASTAWSPTVTARTAWKSIASAPCARLPGAPCSQSRPTMAAATTATSARSTGTPGASPADPEPAGQRSAAEPGGYRLRPVARDPGLQPDRRAAMHQSLSGRAPGCRHRAGLRTAGRSPPHACATRPARRASRAWTANRAGDWSRS